MPPGEQGSARGLGREEAGREGVWRLARRDRRVTVAVPLRLPATPLLVNRSAVLKSRKLQKSFLLQVYG